MKPRIIPGSEADLPVYVFPVQGNPTAPAVIVYSDVFGPRTELFDMCRAFAKRGITAILPNLFSRIGAPMFEPVNAKGAAVSAKVLKANDVTSMDMSVEDTQSILAAIKSGVLSIRPERISAIGYCMGGRHALAATARIPEISAGVSAHGGRLVTNDEAQSPHLLIAGLTKPFRFFHATEDLSCTDEDQWLIGEEALKAGDHVTSQRLAAFHGWSFAGRWSFDPHASQLVFEDAVTMFGGS